MAGGLPDGMIFPLLISVRCLIISLFSCNLPKDLGGDRAQRTFYVVERTLLFSAFLYTVAVCTC